MNTVPYLQVEVHFKSTALGGRKTAVDLEKGSYRPHFVVEPNQLLGVVFLQADTFVVRPGDTTIATVGLMYSGVDYSALRPNTVFEVVEGTHVVATGIVLP